MSNALDQAGRIHKLSPDETEAIIIAPAPPKWMREKREITGVTVFYHDGRMLTADQRKKIMTLIFEIAMWQSEEREATRNEFTELFCAQHEDVVAGKNTFSLSTKKYNTASMTEANAFITWLIDFIIEWDIPTRMPLIENAVDVGRYLYACLINRKCCLCGKEKSDLHHAEDRIGMGNDRRKIDHRGMRAMALCREHHIEAHSMSQSLFNDRHKVYGIALDDYLVKKLKLGGVEYAE